MIIYEVKTRESVAFPLPSMTHTPFHPSPALLGLAAVLLGFAHTFASSLVWLALAGFAGGLFIVPLNAFLQEHAEPEVPLGGDLRRDVGGELHRSGVPRTAEVVFGKPRIEAEPGGGE